MVKVWHNNRCGKSRDAVKYLESNNIDFEIVEYLKNNFSKDDLQEVIKMLGISDVREMLRTKEKEYKENNLKDDSLTQATIIDIVVANPKLVERPIVINGNKAVIARPLEEIEKVLG
jgi:arsenate reductase